MTVKTGVSFENEDLVRWITEDLEYGDSRSERIQHLCEIGRAFEEVSAEYRVDVPEAEVEKRTLIRSVFAAAEREGTL